MSKKKDKHLNQKIDNIDIYICTHKDFAPCPTNDTYKIISGGAHVTSDLEQFIDEGTDVSPLEYTYAEGSRIYWVWKNRPIKEYIGFCQYRKYFSEFFDSTSKIRKIFREYDLIVPQPIFIGNSVVAQYTNVHNIDDYMLMRSIINKDFPQYNNSLDVVSYRLNSIFPYNMFIMKGEYFDEYCRFVFGVLQEFANIKGWKTDADVSNYVAENFDKYNKHWPDEKYNTVPYNSRILGFLLERLSNIFYVQHFRKPYVAQVRITQETEIYNKTNES